MIDISPVKKDTLSLYDDLAILKNAEYLSLPQNYGEQHKHIEEKAKAIAEQICKDKNVLNDAHAFESNFIVVKNRLIQAWALENERKAIRCPHELSQIRNVVSLFEKKYDLTDPRAYIIVRALLSNMLSAYRMQRYTDEAGPVIRYMDKQGNERQYLNPSEEAKRRYNDAVVDAVMKLDAIFEGTKSQSISVQFTPQDFTALFPRVTSESPIKTRFIDSSNTNTTQ